MTDFTHAGYLNLLHHLTSKLKYRVSPLRAFPANGDAVVLRHDIDFSISKAVEMAELDREAGVNSTFFVLLTSPFYNALSQDNLELLRRIKGLGHEIGLHYDCSPFDGLSPHEMEARIGVLIHSLSTLLEVEITSISQHKPATSKIHPVFEGYRDAYSPQYFRDIGYLSDSRMRFGAPDVLEFFERNRRSQLVIHPIWWNKEKTTLPAIVDSFKDRASKELHQHADQFHAGIKAGLARLQN
jgi:hypothetical protein